MFDLQKALDERLAILKRQQANPDQEPQADSISKESIIISLQQAGILDKNGKMIKLVSD